MEAATKPYHDSSICQCGDDPLDEVPTGPACKCQCDGCCEARQRVLGLWRLSNLADKLDSMGIDVDDLATIIWATIETTLEERIDKMARKAIREVLHEIKLVSAVQWSSIKD